MFINECRIDMNTHRYICFCFSNMHLQRGDIHTLTHTHTQKKKAQTMKKKRNIQLSSSFFLCY